MLLELLGYVVVVTAGLWGPIKELGERSARYQSFKDIPGLSDDGGYFPGTLFSDGPGTKLDITDDQWELWRNLRDQLIGSVVIYTTWSFVVDFLAIRIGSKLLAKYLRSVFVLVTSCILFWKLYGFFFWVVGAYSLVNYVLVEGLLLVKIFNRWRLIGLLIVWGFNLSVIYYGPEIQAYLVESCKEWERFAHVSFMTSGLPFWLAPGRLQFHSNFKFALYRCIDYGSSRFLSQSEKEKHNNVVHYLSFCLYTPLVWQGPIMGYRDFMHSLNSRYRKNGKLRRIKYRQVFSNAFKIACDVALMEFINHHFFVGMFLQRSVHLRMHAGETMVMLILVVVKSYLRMLVSWRYFRTWALLDRVTPPENFLKCIFRSESVEDLWRNFNASVHLWMLDNIYVPVCGWMHLPGDVATLMAFAFMAVWHGSSDAWIIFAFVNATMILLEQRMPSRLLLFNLPRVIRAGMTYITWSLKSLILLACWLNFKTKRENQMQLEKPVELLSRAFLDDSVEARLAISFSIDNQARYEERLLWSMVPYPYQVFLGTFGLLCATRYLIDVLYCKSEDSPSYEPRERSDGFQHLDGSVLRAMATENANEMFERAETLCDVLDIRATTPHVGYVWLNGKCNIESQLTFKELRQRARRVAAAIQGYCRPGDRVVLVYPPGLEFIVALFGCMYAGVIAVPVYPPKPGETDRDRVFQNVLNDCKPTLILSDKVFMGYRVMVYAKDVIMPFFLWSVLPVLIAYVLLVRVEFSIKTDRWHIIDAELKNTVGLSSHFDYLTLVFIGVLLFWLFEKRTATTTNINNSKNKKIPWLISDLLMLCAGNTATTWLKNPKRSDIAYLQYTSGSTGDPKGVCITHGNLMHQGFVNQISFGCVGPSQTGVNWCPQYHDLGLVVCILSGLFAGIRLVCFSPFDFLQDPLLWIRAMSRYRATFSAAPNFAYAYVARKYRENPAALGEGVDLSGWRIAGNGGEPVRCSALDQFLQFAETLGFRTTSFFPCFGLAEHTILATGRGGDVTPFVLFLDGRDMERHKVTILDPHGDDLSNATPFVSCGHPFPDVNIIIVNPDTLRECVAGQIGEIWIDSPSVAKQGYWNYEEEVNNEIFHAQTRDIPNRTYLRTGDLGFLYENQLFICGRLKDLIIVEGRNIYPQDIEMLAEATCPTVFRPGSSAAFMLNENYKSSSLVLVVELQRDMALRKDMRKQIEMACKSAYQAILKECRITVSNIIVVPAKTLEKTSSGKVRRRKVRTELSYLKVLYEATTQVLGSSGLAENDEEELQNDSFGYSNDEEFESILQVILQSSLVPLSEGIAANDLSNRPIQMLIGNDESCFTSLEAVQFASKLRKNVTAMDEDLALAVTPDIAFHHSTIKDLAVFLHNQL